MVEGLDTMSQEQRIELVNLYKEVRANIEGR